MNVRKTFHFCPIVLQSARASFKKSERKENVPFCFYCSQVKTCVLSLVIASKVYNRAEKKYILQIYYLTVSTVRCYSFIIHFLLAYLPTFTYMHTRTYCTFCTFVLHYVLHLSFVHRFFFINSILLRRTSIRRILDLITLLEDIIF